MHFSIIRNNFAIMTDKERIISVKASREKFPSLRGVGRSLTGWNLNHPPSPTSKEDKDKTFPRRAWEGVEVN